MKINQTKLSSLTIKLIVAASLLGTMQIASAMTRTRMWQPQPVCSCVLDCGHWYVGGNVGISHLHDDANPGSGDSVNENGPGGSVVGGYQFNRFLGVELGYTRYENSRESTDGTIIAKTEHYSAHLAATGRYPMIDRWSVLGKLGGAYSYAQKMAIATGTTATSGAGSVYWGLGLDYSLTPRVDFIAQFAEAVGNHLTGSADLWSLGVNFAIV